MLTAIISAATALLVLALGSILSRRREQESDWRKLKLDRYREYVIALSGTVDERMTRDSHLKYADAVNALLLVAPRNVLRALDAFIKHTNYRNPDRNNIDKHDTLLGELIRAMHRDLQPACRNDDPNLRFKLLGVPPDDWSLTKTLEGAKAAE